MFQLDETLLVKNIDSLADQIVDFNSEDSKITRKFVPQLGLKISQKPIDYWQSKFLTKHVTKSFKSLLDEIKSASNMHYERKQYKLDEDPWDNYLFHDAQKLVPLICHTEPLSIVQQIVLARFIEYTMSSETISQYSMQHNLLIKELMAFTSNFGTESQNDEVYGEDDILQDSDEEIEESAKSSGLMQKVEKALRDEMSLEEIKELDTDMNRMLKMFYLEMRVKGQLREYKDDYFG